MNIEELFRKLSFGEFSNISLGSEGNGQIRHKDQPRVVAFLNDALADLYTRFVLSEKELIIEMQEGLTNYHLNPLFARSNCDSCNKNKKYIIDCADPYQDDLLKVLSVMNGWGDDVPLNDAENPRSVYTPRVDMLQVPNPVAGQILRLTYQARHPQLEYGILGQKFWVPPILEPAITAYIASKVYSAMNGEEHTMKGQEYMATYERICGTVVDRDSVNNTQSNNISHKFHQRGFV